ncbi:MAG TPA: hypothetical protein VL137_05305 [Polyangiaceae bacterium]|nr:hypothetical protein [Polyangiaceae bacterium]
MAKAHSLLSPVRLLVASYVLVLGATAWVACSSEADPAAQSRSGGAQPGAQQVPGVVLGPAEAPPVTQTQGTQARAPSPSRTLAADTSSNTSPSVVAGLGEGRESAPPTDALVAMSRNLEQRITPPIASVAGAQMLFVSCDKTPCMTRTQAPSLAALRQVLTALSSEFSGQIAFTVRERLSAYAGHAFEADVIVGVAQGAQQPVPSDENDLLIEP